MALTLQAIDAMLKVNRYWCRFIIPFQICLSISWKDQETLM